MHILGVRLDEVDETQAQNQARIFMLGPGQHFIFTPNPEMLVDATRDQYFKQVLNSGHLNLCDGIGVALASHGRLRRITGADFMLTVCRLAEEYGASVFLFGSGDDETVRRTEMELKNMFPCLRIVGTHAGPQIDYQTINRRRELLINSADNDAALRAISSISPDVLLVALSHNKQEKWIARYVPELPSVRIAMGVGGAFDFLAGKARRAPLILRRLGLEWLWRLAHEPRRIGRIWKATAVFCYLLLKSRFASRARFTH